jgi:hypothetical protein
MSIRVYLRTETTSEYPDATSVELRDGDLVVFQTGYEIAHWVKGSWSGYEQDALASGIPASRLARTPAVRIAEDQTFTD